MRGFFRCAAAAAWLLVGATAGFSQEANAPPFDWLAAPPQEHGLSPERLEDLRASLEAAQTKALLVVRNDRIVLEWYAKGQ